METDPNRWPGLTEAVAQQRLLDEGRNELPSSKPRGVLGTALDVVKEPMFLLLVACGALYLVLGDWKEALLLLGFVFLIMAITFIQERRTERALEALRDLSSPRALVIRDGQPRRIAGRDVARGDVLLLAEGDRVPADAVVLEFGRSSLVLRSHGGRGTERLGETTETLLVAASKTAKGTYSVQLLRETLAAAPAESVAFSQSDSGTAVLRVAGSDTNPTWIGVVSDLTLGKPKS